MHRSVRYGTSLVEVVVSAGLTGLVLVAALDAVGGAVLATRIGDQQVDARLLAESLLAEVVAKPYEDPGDPNDVVFGIESEEPSSPSNRSAFDDVDDFDGWTESPPVDRNGTPLTGLTGWTRDVNVVKVSWSDFLSQIGDASPDQGAKKVIVTVTNPQGVSTSNCAIRSKYGSLEQRSGVITNVVSEIAITLDTMGEVLTAQAALSNHNGE